MRLRGQLVNLRSMYTRLLLVVVGALPLFVSSDRPSFCEKWKGDSEFHCLKDGFHADSVFIRNIAKTKVSFKVSKLTSPCGGPVVTLFYQESFDLESGGNMDVDFDEAASGTCMELYVFECKEGDKSVDCLQIVSVNPLEAATFSFCSSPRNGTLFIPVLPSRDGAMSI